jgi:hypothetical protein
VQRGGAPSLSAGAALLRLPRPYPRVTERIMLQRNLRRVTVPQHTSSQPAVLRHDWRRVQDEEQAQEASWIRRTCFVTRETGSVMPRLVRIGELLWSTIPQRVQW